MPINDGVNAPATSTPTGLTVGLGPQQRLELAMRRARTDDPAGSIPDPGSFGDNQTVGVGNPYGRGVSAFEPNNVIFDAYTKAYRESAVSAAAEAETKAGAGAVPGAMPDLPTIQGDGQVKGLVDAALQLAARRVPYVWGGTSATGVDCSGLIYYAARAAGIDIPRYRAVDYGRMGQAVTLEDARPGDIVYYDNPGDTDHVGIYLGGGQVVQAPQTGDVVRVTGVGRATSIRRIFDDAAFGTIAVGPASTATSYNGRAYSPGQIQSWVNQIPALAPAPTSVLSRRAATETKSNRRTTGASAF